MVSSTDGATPPSGPAHGWTLEKLARRAVLGTVLLSAFVGLGAWGLHQGTEPADSPSARLGNVSSWRLVNSTEPLGQSSSLAEHGSVRRPIDGPGSWPVNVTVLDATATRDVLATHIPLRSGLSERVLATLATGHAAPDGAVTLFGAPERPLDRVVAAGFAGVVLDVGMAAGDTGEIAEIVKLATRHARRLAPNFIVVIAGREEIIAQTDLLRQIDGLIKANLLTDARTGQPGDDDAAVAASRLYLDRARRSGKVILVVERVARFDDGERIATQLRRMGYLPLIDVKAPLREARSRTP